MKLEFHPEAEQEFLEAVLRYEAEVPGLGGRFDAEIREATAVLLDYPEIGAVIDIELRKLVLDAFRTLSSTAFLPKQFTCLR